MSRYSSFYLHLVISTSSFYRIDSWSPSSSFLISFFIFCVLHLYYVFPLPNSISLNVPHQCSTNTTQHNIILPSSAVQKKEVKERALYDMLGVEPEASAGENHTTSHHISKRSDVMLCDGTGWDGISIDECSELNFPFPT